MFPPEVLAIIKGKVLFMGTSCDNVPSVRPMKPYIDENHTIWLVSHADTEKINEIRLNNRVELCALSDKNDVLRMKGRLVPEKEIAAAETTSVRRQLVENLPLLKEVFSNPDDANMVIYKVLVEEIIYGDIDSSKKHKLNFRPV